MSWSVSALGKPKAVAVKLAADLANIDRMNMENPEQLAKNNAAATIAATLAVYPDNQIVRVEASGSQYAPNGVPDPLRISTHSLKIENLGAILE
jgi:hypothetical protein